MNGLVWSVLHLKERPSGDNAAYLYKGSKVRNLVGGVNPTAAGNIHPYRCAAYNNSEL